MLELDELWSFVLRRKDKRWIWLAWIWLALRRKDKRWIWLAWIWLALRRKDTRWIWLAWIWLALRRRTRQVVAYAVGCRGQETCQLVWERVPFSYKAGLLYTDFWSAYADVLPAGQHRATGKGAGQTCHIERFNNTLRQRMARFVRRTLSFSKLDAMHDNCLRLFLDEYNQPNYQQPSRRKHNAAKRY